MSKKRRAKALKTANTLVSKKAQLDQSWEQLKQRHASWPKFGGKYGTALQQVPKAQPRNQLQGTTTGRISSRDWHIVELDRSPGLDDRVRTVQVAGFHAQAMVAEMDLSKVEEKVAASAFDYCRDGEAKAAFIERFGQEEWDKREAEAGAVKHTVLPMHKSNYMLVTDTEMIPLMVSKPGSKT